MPGSFETMFEADLKTLPARITRRDSRIAAAFLIVFALLFGGSPAAALVWAISAGQYVPAMLWTVIAFAIIGAGVGVVSVNLAVTRTDIMISFDLIKYDFTSLFKKYSWTEPLSAYRGVILGQKKFGRNVCNVIGLRHDAPGRSVDLAAYLTGWVTEEEVRSRWEGYAARLNLPALRAGPEGIASRAPAELNTPLADSKPDGSAEPGPPPPGISRATIAGVDVITITAKRTMRLSTFALLLFLTLLAWIGFFSTPSPSVGLIVTGAFGALLGGWTILYTVFDLLTSQQIKIGRGAVTVSRRTPFGDTAGRSVSAREIEEVRVGLAATQRVNALIIDSDKKIISAGHWLPLATLHWLKAAVEGKLRDR